MKKILLCSVLFFIVFNSYGQSTYNYYLTFDNGPFIIYDFGYGADTTYYPDSLYISIDTIDYHNNQWQIGRPQKTIFNSAYSYPNAIVTDTLHPCLPNDTSVFIITTPSMYFGGEFSFEYELNIDSGDFATVEISEDGGANWVNLLTGSTSITGWENFSASFDDTSFSYFYLFRFTLITDSNTSPRDGWMMDNG